MRAALCLSLAVLAGCHKSSPTPTSPGAGEPPGTGLADTLTFAQAPIDPAVIEFVVPPGNLNPPGHTLPTDHAYFYHRLRHPDAPFYPVVAPAAGRVKFVMGGNDDALGVQVTASTFYYLGHVLLDPGFSPGMPIALGQRLGTTSHLSFGLDLGVVNDAVTVFFVNPARYGDNTLHAESPLPYFAEPLRTELYAKIEGGVSRNDGRIDFDRPGRLAGNWFLEGLPASESSIVDAGPRQMAFVRDVLTPSALRISIGGTLPLKGVFVVEPGAPDPSDVSVASGPVGYRLLPAPDAWYAAGLLMVQLLDDMRLRVEAFPDVQDATAEFTPAARIYLR